MARLFDDPYLKAQLDWLPIIEEDIDIESLGEEDCFRVFGYDVAVLESVLKSLKKHEGTPYFKIHRYGHRRACLAFIKDPKSPTCFIMPGGGYHMVSLGNEGFDIAEGLFENGYNAVIVKYRVGEHTHYPNPIEDGIEAVSLMEKFGIENPDYGLFGFSAGGHLAGYMPIELARKGMRAPKAVVLGYPVVNFLGNDSLGGTRKNFLQEKADDIDLRMYYSIPNNIKADYPPTFVFSFKNDCVVPFLENTSQLIANLAQNNVACDYRLYEGDLHGVGLGYGTPAEDWFGGALAFLRKHLN